VYDDPGFCTELANYNGLTTIRKLKAGIQLSLPPLIKLSPNG
jgi:hypothetical protein